ncbi:GNAT family N-acetyltransferase [Nakamurella endophytica]|uniref:GNAT family N-acetyltransferase n=1 Tax=Nakamurella endophytica TaxID=1748367 RepID=UPI001669FEDF
MHGERVLLRPVQDADRAVLVAIRSRPEVARWWGPPETDEWPLDGDEDEHRFTVVADGRVVGLVQYGEEPDPMYRHAGIDVFLSPDVHGRGLGRDAVRTLARHLIDDLGHHRLVIDPAADNIAAVRAYAAVGFRSVGRMRRYERDPDGHGWRDGLLMDMLADELQ